MPLPSFFPDWKKPPPTKPTAPSDDLAAVKAAAWAWYQHGSGSESKPMREFGLTRPIILPKPSRYKLEAIKIAQKSIEANSQTPNLHNTLLDSYEVASISRRLSDLLGRNNFSFKSFESEILDLGRRIEGKPTKPKKYFRPFWRKPAVMCGKMEDVVLATLVRSPDKHHHRPTRRRSTAVPDGL